MSKVSPLQRRGPGTGVDPLPASQDSVHPAANSPFCQRRKDCLWPSVPAHPPAPQTPPPAPTPRWGLALEGALEASGSHVGLPGEVFGRRASGWSFPKPWVQEKHRLEPGCDGTGLGCGVYGGMSGSLVP